MLARYFVKMSVDLRNSNKPYPCFGGSSTKFVKKKDERYKVDYMFKIIFFLVTITTIRVCVYLRTKI